MCLLAALLFFFPPLVRKTHAAFIFVKFCLARVIPHTEASLDLNRF